MHARILPGLIFFVTCLLISLCLPAQTATKNIKQTDGLSEQQNGDSAKPVITTGIPEGYEDLLEPQLTLVDIYFNGILVGATLASYTPETIAFEEPQEILTMLTSLIDPQSLLSYLTVLFPTNQSRLCFYQGQPDCGVLRPQVVGVIFDESRLKVDLFINPTLLKQQTLAIDKYLPLSTSGASMINALSMAFSGGELREDFYAAQLNTTFGYKNYHVIANIESDSQNNTRLDQLSMVYENRNLSFQVGSFRTRTQSNDFFGQRDFLGVRVESSLASRTDLEQASGSRIFLFLNERSRVEVFKDGQLLDSRLYQAGNIELDSRDFPQGAYNLEIKVVGDSGRERVETHFYSKSLTLPPIDESLFFFEAGYPEDDRRENYPVAKDDALARFGYVSRPFDFFGASIALAKNRQQQSAEFGTYWLANQLELQTNHAITADSDHASYYLLNLRRPDFFLSASYRRTYTDRQSSINSELRLIAENSRQTVINLGMPLSDSILNIFARTSTFEEADNFRAYGLSWRKNLFRSGRMLLDWNIDFSKEKDDKRLLTGLTLRFLNRNWSWDSNLSYQNRQTAQQTQRYWDQYLRVTHRDIESDYGSLTNSLELSNTAERTSAVYQSEVSNDYGQSRLILENINGGSQIDDSEGNSGSRNRYSLTGHFNFVTSGGEIVIGGNRQNAAGILIDLEMVETEGLDFSVIINRVERTRVKAGGKTFVALPPYESYQVTLIPLGETLVNFDNTPKQFTLYPGNVENLVWRIKPVKVIILQLINDGEPFSNSRLQSDNIYARTDESGWIQMEVSEAAELRFVNSLSQECKIKLDEKDLLEGVNYLGSRDCL